MSHLSAKPRLTHWCCWRKIPETINVQLIIKEDQSNSLINRGLQVYRAFQDADGKKKGLFCSDVQWKSCASLHFIKILLPAWVNMCSLTVDFLLSKI